MELASTASLKYRIESFRQKEDKFESTDEHILRYLIITYELRNAIADTLIELSCLAVPAVSLI